MDHRTGTHCGTGSPNDPSRGSESPTGSKKQETENSDQEDEIEELDVREFNELIEQFTREPLNFINSPHEIKKNFISWINYDNAKDILNQYNILKRYNNECHPGIWIQDSSLDFTSRTQFDVSNFRYKNSSGTSDDEAFEKKNGYLKNYWNVEGDDIPKLRKYYQRKKTLAVIVQFRNLQPKRADQRPTKRQKRKRNEEETTNVPLTGPSGETSSINTVGAYYSAPQNYTPYAMNNSNVGYSTFGSDPASDNVVYQHAQYMQYTNDSNLVSGHLTPSTYQPDQHFNYFPAEYADAPMPDDVAQMESNRVPSEYLPREEFEELKNTVERLHMQVNSNQASVDTLTQSFSHLQVQTNQNTVDICRLDTEVREFVSESNRPILHALLEIFKKGNGIATPGSKLANNVRKILNKTREELPDRIVSNFLHHTLVARKIVDVFSEEKKCVFNRAKAQQYGLQID